MQRFWFTYLGFLLGFFSTSSGVFSKIFIRMLLPELVETCKNELPEAVLKTLQGFPIKTHIKVLKQNGVLNGKVRTSIKY